MSAAGVAGDSARVSRSVMLAIEGVLMRRIDSQLNFFVSGFAMLALAVFVLPACEGSSGADSGDTGIDSGDSNPPPDSSGGDSADSADSADFPEFTGDVCVLSIVERGGCSPRMGCSEVESAECGGVYTSASARDGTRGTGSPMSVY